MPYFEYDGKEYKVDDVYEWTFKSWDQSKSYCCYYVNYDSIGGFYYIDNEHNSAFIEEKIPSSKSLEYDQYKINGFVIKTFISNHNKFKGNHKTDKVNLKGNILDEYFAGGNKLAKLCN